MSGEQCDECGFDGGDWRARDAGSLLESLGWWWTQAVENTTAALLNTRPRPDVWSVLEYGLHSAMTMSAVFAGRSLPPLGEVAGMGPPAQLDAESVIADIERESTRLASVAKRVNDGAALDALLHAAHEASHHQMDVSRILGGPSGSGTVAQVNASDGGVPKHRTPEAAITRSGLAGDRQADRKHHGRAYQALCLWSSDVIAELAAQGHPIAAGCAGENLTIAGIRWSSLRPGTRLRIGTALAEISFPATPCAKQTQWFVDGDFGVMDHDRNPQWTRWYAWVREPGEVAEGDPIIVNVA